MPFDLKMPSPIDPNAAQEAPEVNEALRIPHQHACESEPLYNWRTDPYYNEESIRKRLKAAKAKILPVSVNDTKMN